jgi:hypothetical protein
LDASLAQLPALQLTALDRGWLLAAVLMVIVRVSQLARHL